MTFLPDRAGIGIDSCADEDFCLLIASQDHLFRSRLSAAFRTDGYRVCESEAGLRILYSLRRPCKEGYRANAIILDISNNPWVGVSILKAVFCEDWTMPIILITSSDVNVHSLVLNQRIHANIKKPIDIMELRAIVARLRLRKNLVQGQVGA